MREPTAASVALRAVAPFEVEAKGSRPINYQWFEDGLLMLGETNPLLSVRVSTESLYGNTYRALITNPRGAIFSAEALLQPNLEGGMDVEFSNLPQFAKTTTPQLDDFHLNLRAAGRRWLGAFSGRFCRSRKSGDRKSTQRRDPQRR